MEKKDTSEESVKEGYSPEDSPDLLREHAPYVRALAV
jgi:hypothetical protein